VLKNSKNPEPLKLKFYLAVFDTIALMTVIMQQFPYKYEI